MIKYQKVSGVTLDSSSGLPSITSTPEGLAMGSVPGWAVFIDPDYSDGTSVRNRAIANTVPALSDPADFTQINGQTAFNLTEVNPSQIESPGGDINPDRWTVFFVSSDTSEHPNTTRQHVVTPYVAASDVVCLHISVVNTTSAVAVTIYENSERSAGQPYRLAHENSGLDSSDPSLIMCTFSIERGLSIFKNGEMVADEPNDLRPLNYGTKGDEYAMMMYRLCKQGMAGILNTDLSAPENTGHRRAIEKFLMSKYGIS